MAALRQKARRHPCNPTASIIGPTLTLTLSLNYATPGLHPYTLTAPNA
jgi:hypothetical protein